ncbi:RNA-directed DNA polymerase, eukaryota [Tanacetum coccineum]
MMRFFMGQWCDGNISTLIHVLECFYRASGLRINMSKSKILGVNVDSDKVKGVASKLGCLILKTPFTYLGSKVGGSMSRVHAWNEVIDRVKNRLSKWKMKTLSIGDKWDLESSGDFSVASVRKIIDDKSLSDVDSKTRWIKYVPIKVNVHAWKVKTDSLPTRFNVSRRGIDIDSIMCAICDNGVETSRHLFFYCCMVRQIVRKITRWWDVPYVEVESYEDWYNWLVNLRISSMHKQMFEGIDVMRRLVVKMKKSGGNNGGIKNFKPVSVKPKTKYRPKVNQPTEEVCPKTVPPAGKKKVSTTVTSSKKTSKTKASTSGNGTFSHNNSFEVLNVDNPGIEEVDSRNKASMCGVQ